jgi:hypothetical protein
MRYRLIGGIADGEDVCLSDDTKEWHVRKTLPRPDMPLQWEEKYSSYTRRTIKEGNKETSLFVEQSMSLFDALLWLQDKYVAEARIIEMTWLCADNESNLLVNVHLQREEYTATAVDGEVSKKHGVADFVTDCGGICRVRRENDGRILFQELRSGAKLRIHEGPAVPGIDGSF